MDLSLTEKVFEQYIKLDSVTIRSYKVVALFSKCHIFINYVCVTFGSLSIRKNQYKCNTSVSYNLKLTVVLNPQSKILDEVWSKGGKDHNIVHQLSSFCFKGHHCMEFENLDISLFDFQTKNGRMSLVCIRPIMHQVGHSYSV